MDDPVYSPVQQITTPQVHGPGYVDPKVLMAVHPEIAAIVSRWKRIKILIESLEEFYRDDDFFLTLPNEDPTKKTARLPWFTHGFFNPSQELVSIPGDYIVRRGVERKTENEDIKSFIAKADRSGQSMNEFIKNQAAVNLRAYGTVFAVVDKPNQLTQTKAQDKANPPYLCILDPGQVVNWAWAKDGSLDWFRYVTVQAVDEEKPFGTEPKTKRRFVTWTKTDYFLHEENGEQVSTLTHGFGVVPVAIQAIFTLSDKNTLGKSTFFASSRHLIMGNNMLSVGNYEIAKYGSILLIDRQDMDSNRVTRKLEAGTNEPVMTTPGKTVGEMMPVQDMAKKPEYLTKDIQVVEKANAQAQWYFIWAAETEATGKEAMPLNGKHGNPQSGIAKAYDFQDMDANLATTAMSLQHFEMQIFRIYCAMQKITNDVSVRYPQTFDVRSFKDKIQRLVDLNDIRFASETGMRAAQKSLIEDLTNEEAEAKTISDEIDAAVITAAPVTNPMGTTNPVKPGTAAQAAATP